MNEIQSNYLRFNNELLGKDAWITFTDTETEVSYRYPHDQILNAIVIQTGQIHTTAAWMKGGVYTYPTIPDKIKKILEQRRILNDH
jgi:hypothetical protein